MKMLEKLMAKKSGKELDPNYKNAKMSMLESLRDHMSGMMKDDLVNGHAANLKKVEVAAPDQSSLAEGLDKAKDMLGGASGEDSDEGTEDASDDNGSEDAIGLEGTEDGSDDSATAEKTIADMIEHEASEGDLSDDDIEKLEMLLQKAKLKKGIL